MKIPYDDKTKVESVKKPPKTGSSLVPPSYGLSFVDSAAIQRNENNAVEPANQIKNDTSIGNRPLQKVSKTLPSKNGGYNAVNPVAQLRVKEKSVTGITHLVRMVNGSLYNQNYQSNEVREVEHGDIVKIDEDITYYSRRGPNQETHHDIDRTGPQHYKWFKVISVNATPVGPNVFIRDKTFIEARHSVRDILLNTAQQVNVDPDHFENCLQDPYSSVVSTSALDSLGPALGPLTLQDPKLTGHAVRKLDFKNYYDLLMKHNLLTGSCGQTSDTLLEMVTPPDKEPPKEKSDIDSMINVLASCTADPWYCRIMVAPHSFMLERTGKIGRIYQSYFGHYTLMSKLKDDHPYPLRQLLAMVRTALNQSTSTMQNRESIFHARAQFTESHATYSLITKPLEVHQIAQNVMARYGSRTATWKQYMEDPRTMEQHNPTQKQDDSLIDAPNASYDLFVEDDGLTDTFKIIENGAMSLDVFTKTANDDGVTGLMRLNKEGKFKGFIVAFKRKPDGSKNRFVFGGKALTFSDGCVRFVRVDTTDARESGNLP